MAKQEDYYKLLGVARTASEDEIKKAYRKAAMKYHPDRNPDNQVAEAKFKEVSEAYEVLKDSQKRSAYDNFGHSAFQGGGHGSAGGSGGGFDGFGTSDFSDIFNDLFGGSVNSRGAKRASRSDRRARGADLRYDLSVSLEEAFSGTKTPISYVTHAKCEKCNGNGSEGDSRPVECSTCNGAGMIRAQQGFFTIERTCHVCHGHGTIIQNRCKKCGGEGRHRSEVKISATIPPGVDNGSRIRLSGKGEAGANGGSAGDLYVCIAIKKHKLFSRKGAEIYCEVPVSMPVASLSGEIEVPSLDGSKIKIKVPEGTQTSDKLRIKNKGMRRLNSQSRGDMYVTIVVETPVRLSRVQKEILQKFAETSSGSSPKSESFFSKIKDFLRS